jgi:hypothetical protein
VEPREQAAHALLGGVLDTPLGFVNPIKDEAQGFLGPKHKAQKYIIIGGKHKNRIRDETFTAVFD